MASSFVVYGFCLVTSPYHISEGAVLFPKIKVCAGIMRNKIKHRENILLMVLLSAAAIELAFNL